MTSESRPFAFQPSETLFRGLLEATPDALVIVDAQSDIVLVNAQTEALFGYGRDELIGQPHDVLLPERFRFAHRQHERRYLLEPRTRPMGEGLELFARHKDGHEFPVEISLSPFTTEEGLLVLSAIRDISDKRRREAELQRRLRQQIIVNELGLYALRTRELSLLLSEVARRACEALEVEYCKILEVSPDGKKLLLKAGCGWHEGHVGVTTVDIGAASLSGYTLQAAQPVIDEDLSQETRFSVPPLLFEHGIRSSLTVIIHGDSKPYGVLGIDSTCPNSFSSDDVIVLQAIANLLSQALLRREAEAALQQLNGELEQRVEVRTQALRESEERFSKAFHASPTPTVIVDLTSLRFLDVNGSFLKLLDYDRREIVNHTLQELNLLLETEKRRPILAQLREGKSVPATEINLRTKDGAVRTVLCSAEPVQLEARACTLATYVDITERKRTEEELMQAIQAAVQDASWFSQSIMEKLVQIRSGEVDKERAVELTKREHEVLMLVAKGWDNRQIAERLQLAPQTVHNYLSRIYDKLGLSSRAEVIVWARKRGFMELE